MNYVCHLGVYRRRLLQEVGGFRAGFEGSQDYDLVLRFTEKTPRVAHVPKVLYHWRIIAGSAAGSMDAKPYAHVSAEKALNEALRRRGAGGDVKMEAPGRFRVEYAIADAPLVSIIIPTRNGAQLLES